MKLKNITITNVKSFNNPTTIEFDSKFNIIIGPNASGKSNLMDIITIGLNNYFLHNYNDQNNGPNNVAIFRSSAFDNTHLERYNGNTGDQKIDFTFVVKQEDINNIRIFKEDKQKFIQHIQAYSSGHREVINDFSAIDWDDSVFNEDEILVYQIHNNNLLVKQDYEINALPEGEKVQSLKHLQFLRYLNYASLYGEHSPKFSSNTLKPVFLFLGPYRGVNNPSDFEGNLSNSKSINIYKGIKNATSKVNISLINLATVYFAEKKRSMEAKAMTVAYQMAWEGDPEVILVSKYLKKMGYEWVLALKDQNKNIYEIELTKGGQVLLLNQASSGEKEIINYLFGIFALKITSGLIIIDEPELHLHPRWQLLLLNLFMELTGQTGNQFLITTHSSVFINVNSVNNLIRVYRENKETRNISLKKTAAKSELKDLLHIVNSTNNEKIFFADFVVLVEGISDRLVFQKIISSIITKYDVLSVVEVVEINGKGNIKKFRKYLKLLEIPYCFIADLDYINEVGPTSLKELFVADLGAVDSNAIKNVRSTDGKKLIEILEEAVRNNDVSSVQEFLEYMKSHRRKIKDPLSLEEKKSLDKFIKERTRKNEYILREGAIEKYLPQGYLAKDLEKLLELLDEPLYGEWQKSDKFKYLKGLAEQILKDSGLLTN